MEDTTLEIETDFGYAQAMRGAVEIPRHKRDKWTKEAQSLFHPTPNGRNDPLTHMLVVDTLMRLKPDQMIRAGKLRDILAQQRPQISWDAVTVGRVMTELADVDREHNVTPRIRTGRDAKNTYFVVTNAPDTFAWLATVRQYLSEQVAEEKRQERNGFGKPGRMFSVWDAFKNPQIAIGTGMASIFLKHLFDRTELLNTVMEMVK